MRQLHSGVGGTALAEIVDLGCDKAPGVASRNLLLQRTTRKMTPTRDGAAFYERCVRVIADVEETEALFRQTDASPRGKLRIDVPSRIGRLVIAPRAPEFLERYPHIDIVFGSTDREVNLVEEQVDCVVRVGQVSAPGLYARPLGSLPLINVASPAYLARYGAPQHPSDLGHHVAVQYALRASGEVEDWEWIENGRAIQTSVGGRVTVNNAETYIACCLVGLGLIQIPAYDVAAHIEAGELVEVMAAYRAAAMPMSLLYPRRLHVSRRLQILADWLQSVLLKGIQS